ncbi:MAG TPA: ABC transporter ATP-binding protein [Thermotogaceae bacterium]|nr:ABC transporter ATP-binding protein [Thermotogota bacterium]HEW91460.1 ABC transporter ATP-binding protein [Thermotogaceae bacterium]
MSIIEIENLTKKYNEFKALDGLSLSIREKIVFGLLGPNGAGKTTIIKILSTLLLPTSGEVRIMGYDIYKDAKKIRQSIGLVPENPFLYDKLTVFENLKLFADYYHIPAKDSEARIKRLLHKVDMWKWRDELIKNLSKGMKQRINIIRALINDPKILFLDEPTNGLDPQTNRTIREFLKKLVCDGKTIVVTTHMMYEVEKLCDEVAIIDKGHLVISGKPEDLKKKYSNSNIRDLEDIFIKLTGSEMRDRPKKRIFTWRKKI